MKIKLGCISFVRLWELRDFLKEKGFKCWIDLYDINELIIRIRKKNRNLLSEAIKEFEAKTS